MAQHCIHCGSQLYDEGKYCHVCGKSKVEAPGGSSVAVKAVVLPPDAETTFFQDGAVLVTNARFSVPGRVFSMSEVRRVRLERTGANRSWPTVLYMLGLAALLSRVYGLGLILFTLGALLNAVSRPKFTVVLDSASGEIPAFTSSDRDYISEIVDAVKKAIVYRQ
jgi:hypothetical protein